MGKQMVKDIMVSLAEYATVSQDATLHEAVLALEKAQNAHVQNQYTHRAVLVYDDKGRIVGKLSQNDVLRALEPKYKDMGDMKGITRTGYTVEFIASIMESQGLWRDPLANFCRKAAEMKVRSIMYTPVAGEYVKEGATLAEAIHQLIMGHHQSLLVTRNGEVVGILRLTDAFAAICDMIKTCRL
jgi:CBS-domain-containing membrane protein